MQVPNISQPHENADVDHGRQGAAPEELQGWYNPNNTSEAVRVRLLFEGGSVSLYTLSGRLIASWSLGRLQNRRIPTIGERWLVGDRDLPEASLMLESDRDYDAIRLRSTRLRPLRARLWRQLGFSFIESGNLTGLPVLLLIVGVAAVFWLARNLPWEHCIATEPGTSLFLKCLLIDHFIP